MDAAGQSRLERANALLRMSYGSPQLVESSNHWSLFVRILLVGTSPELANDAVREALDSPALGSPGSLSQTTTGQLVEILSCVPRGSQKASLLRSVAEWWLTVFGNECLPEWSKGVEFYRESLRKIRGLGPATVDELLMFVARMPVFPLDRATLRVAIRHGWLDIPLEETDAQYFFVRGLNDDSIDPREFSRLISRVAETYCGREPKCEDCPLKSVLPPNGPLNPDSC